MNATPGPPRAGEPLDSLHASTPIDLEDGIRYLRELGEGEHGGPWRSAIPRPLFFVHVHTGPYDGRAFQWLPLDHVSPGTAATFPVKARLWNGTMGQWRYSEVTAITITSGGREWLRRKELGPRD